MSQGSEASPADAAAVYLTDEVFLYRVVGLAGNGADAVARLKDSYGLDTVTASATDLRPHPCAPTSRGDNRGG
jgi:hypothetical protein